MSPLELCIAGFLFALWALVLITLFRVGSDGGSGPTGTA